MQHDPKPALLASAMLAKIAEEAKDKLAEMRAGELDSQSGVLLAIATYTAARGADDENALIAPSTPWQRIALACLSRLAPAVADAALADAFGEGKIEPTESAAARLKHYRALLERRGFKAGACRGAAALVSLELYPSLAALAEARGRK